jgi:hypothetical protein
LNRVGPFAVCSARLAVIWLNYHTDFASRGILLAALLPSPHSPETIKVRRQECGRNNRS